MQDSEMTSMSEIIDGPGGGTFHIAAPDIFEHTDPEKDQLFLVRASFEEIEEIS